MTIKGGYCCHDEKNPRDRKGRSGELSLNARSQGSTRIIESNRRYVRRTPSHCDRVTWRKQTIGETRMTVTARAREIGDRVEAFVRDVIVPYEPDPRRGSH